MFTNSQVLRLQQILSSSSKSIEETGDDTASSHLIDFLHSLSPNATVLSDSEKDVATLELVLSDILRFLLSPTLDQAVFDVFSFDLPKTVVKFAGVSDACLESVDGIVDRFVEMCSPRDMLSILCDALDSLSDEDNAHCYVGPILGGLSKGYNVMKEVLISIQRRHFEQVKVAVPVVLKVLKHVPTKLGDRETECVNLFHKALAIADSIHAMCSKLEGKAREKLSALLSLYILQTMALLSLSIGHRTLSCLPLVSKLSQLLRYCGLTYHGLITGSDVGSISNMVVNEDEDEDEIMGSLPYIKHGACLSVIWGHISDEVAQAAGENMHIVENEIKSDQIKRWQAVVMLRHVFVFNLTWELKRHAVNFLLSIIGGNDAPYIHDHDIDWSMHTSLYGATLALTKVIMFAPNAITRKNAFEALKKVLADIPASMRFNILQALITNSDSPSMIAVLLDLVRGSLHEERSQMLSAQKDEVREAENGMSRRTSFWTPEVLGMVEQVLKPPKGGPPLIPEHGDAVMGALNLYRFILMTESAGRTNSTGIVSENNLRKAYNEWFLPLRTLVTGIMAENKKSPDQLSDDIICSLNPVEVVLYHCIELVEEKLKKSK